MPSPGSVTAEAPRRGREHAEEAESVGQPSLCRALAFVARAVTQNAAAPTCSGGEVTAMSESHRGTLGKERSTTIGGREAIGGGVATSSMATLTT